MSLSGPTGPGARAYTLEARDISPQSVGVCTPHTERPCDGKPWLAACGTWEGHRGR